MFRDSLIGLPAPDFPKSEAIGRKSQSFSTPEFPSFAPASATTKALADKSEGKPEIAWLNSEPLRMQDLRGKAVLIDFWTYSCINCIRTLPHLASWHERYKDLGLVIIGVHTPEFEFEKDSQNIKDALKRFGITYPVVIDSDYLIWNSYLNHYWPRKLLINQEGVIVYDHAGEGDYARTEREIQMLIRRGHKDVELPFIEDDAGVGGVCYPMTPETYLGYSRGRVGNPKQKTFTGDSAQDLIFHDPGVYKKDTWYLHGRWRMAGEYIEHVREAGLYEDYIALQFLGAEANLVMESERAAVLEVMLDNKPVELASRGVDIAYHQGKTFVMVKEPRMYRFISAKKLLSGVLKISVKERGVRAYAFTFGGCV